MASNPVNTISFFAPIQDLLEEVENRMRVHNAEHHPDLATALDHLLSSGGKRIRPAVTLLVGSMFHADKPRLVTLAASIELLHTATLVHDDLIDGALLRRGIATLNAKWSPGATVLTGDYIFAQAARLAAETESVQIVKLFSKCLSTIVNGEITQMFSGRGWISREQYQRRIYAKTASLFETAASAAGLLTPADEAALRNLAEFGRQLGMAFQVIDDVLDFSGEQGVVGKPVASDLRQGLVTLPVICFAEQHPDHPDLGVLSSGGFAPADSIERLLAAIRESGAVEQASLEAEKYIEASLAALHRLPDAPARRNLVDLAHYIIRRRS